MVKNIAKNKIRDPFGDKVLNVVTIIILTLLFIAVGYPVIYVISSSISSSKAIEAGLVWLWPVDLSAEAYKFVLAYKDVWVGFRNSFFYCIVDVLFQMSCTLMIAYPLSRAYTQGRNFYNMFFFLTTRIGPGLIPVFILKCDMGLFNNVWAELISGCIGITHVLILRTAINSNIPSDLHDAAMIDGASHFQTVFKLVLPLTKATISVLAFYCIVGQWNEYFNAMIYLRDKRYYPLQLVLRPIMTAASMVNSSAAQQSAYQVAADQGLENVRYALIIISTVPMLTLYYFCQKFFKGGMMMGSIKG